jgi:hypothetical protein
MFNDGTLDAEGYSNEIFHFSLILHLQKKDLVIL